MRLLSNVGTDRVVDHLPAETQLSIATVGTSIPGMARLQSAHRLERLLLSPEAHLQSDPADRHRRNRLTLRGEGVDCLHWLAGAEARVTDLPLRQSLLLCGAPSANRAVVGDCDLTTAGLGVAPSRAAGMIQLLEEPAEVHGLSAWFEELWRRSTTLPVNPLETALQGATAAFTAADVYRRSLASLFNDMMSDDEVLPDRRLGLEDSKVWQMLYRFQRDGVLGGVDKLVDG